MQVFGRRPTRPKHPVDSEVSTLIIGTPQKSQGKTCSSSLKIHETAFH